MNGIIRYKHMVLFHLILCYLIPVNELEAFSDPPIIKFSHLTKADGLSHTLMYRMIEDRNGTIWIGSKDGGGLYRYDGYHLSAYMSDFNNKKSISNNSIISLLEDSKGYIWVGTEGGGLNRLDPRREIFNIYKQDPDVHYSLVHNVVESIMEDQFGNIWIGTREGISRMDDDSGYFCNFLIKSGKGLKHKMVNNVYCLVQDKLDPYKIWMGTAAGLLCFDTRTNSFQPYDNPYTENARWPETQTPRQLPINDMIQDHEGKLWMGTYGAGLLSYDLRKNQWNQYKFEVMGNSGDLFSYNEIFVLCWDGNNILWIGSEQKLGYFDMSTLDFHFYEPKEDDPTSILNTGYYSMLIDHNNVLWGGAYLGLSRSLTPLSKVRDSLPLKTQITNLLVSGRRYDIGENIRYADTVDLHIDQNDIEISFAAINPAFPDQVEYQYQLEGKDEKWKYLSPEDTLTVAYKKLRGDVYNFKVRARMPGEEWGATEHLAINIRKSFTQTIWFYLLVAIVIVSVGMTILSYHQQQIKEKQAIKTAYNQRMMEMEMTSLRAQMNPHFMFNSLNSIKHFIIKNNSRDASRYLSKFSQLMRLILQNSQKAIVLLSNELQALELYMQLEQLRFIRKFNYNIEVDEAIKKDLTQIPPMILQPYVENAIWHGLIHKEEAEEGWIMIAIVKEEESLLISIEDNGIGRKKALELKSRSAIKQKSYGMKITSNRLKLVEKLHQLKTDIQIHDLEDSKGNARGTRVEIKIPLILSDNPEKEYIYDHISKNLT